MVELALILPILLILVFGVIDFGRAIHYNNVIVNMSREGANLSSRAGGSISKQNVIVALVETAEPLSMKTEGMIYITEVDARPDGTAEVVAQYRATSGDSGLVSQTWTCPSWGAGGVCNVPNPRPIINLGVNLLPDEKGIFAVEVMYDYQILLDYVMKIGPKLYSRTVM